MTERNITNLIIVEKRKLYRTRKRAMLPQLAFWSTTHSVQTTASIVRPSLISLPCRRVVKYYRHNSIMTHCLGLLPACLWLAKQRHCYCAGAITSCFYPRTLACAGISCRRVSVCLSFRLSVTSRCSTDTTKRKITQTTPHVSPGNLVFWCRKPRQNSESPRMEAPNAGEVG